MSIPTIGDFCHLLVTFTNSLVPDKKLGLIWMETVLHSDFIFEKLFLKKKQSADDKSMQDYPVLKCLIITIWVWAGSYKEAFHYHHLIGSNNHATSNSAIYSHETYQDKLSEA